MRVIHWLLKRCVILAWICVPLAVSTAANAQTRVALVVGNNAYTKVSPLNNAVNDAAVVSEELRKNGFQVIRVIDAKGNELQEAKRRFLAAVANGGIGVFYFSGHGLQVEGRNYLLPVDFSDVSAAGFAQQAFSVPAFLDELEKAKPRLSILILDACRDNPFVQAPVQVAKRGLSEVAKPIPSGVLVLYAASSNQAALDAIPNRPSKHGLFTGELLSAMRQPGLEIRELAQRVRYSVMEKAEGAGHLQVPALYDNLSPGAFYLGSPAQQAQVSATGQALPRQIKIIIPFAEKSPSDVVIRSLVPILAKSVNREIVVENLIDVQGEKVAQLLAESPKDGSVLLISPFAASARRLRSNDNRIVPVGIVADTPLSIVVREGVTARDLPELFASSRLAGRRLRMTVPLKGSPSEMCALQLQSKFGADVFELVSFNGEAAAFTEVANGNADLTCGNTASMRGATSQPNSKVRELAEIRSTSSPLAQRNRAAVSGAQGFDIIAPNWLGLYAPAGLSADRIALLSQALVRMQSDPAVVQALSRMHALPVSADQSTPEGLLQSLRLAISLQK